MLLVLGAIAIFFSTRSNYIDHAFWFSAVDYLFRPVDVYQLIEAVARAIKRINEKPEGGNETKGSMDLL